MTTISSPIAASKLKESKKAIPYLDGIRGLAIVMVICCHAWGFTGRAPVRLFGFDVSSLLTLSQSGVELFFVLSGYLLYITLSDELNASAVREYFKKRILRIIPAYYLAIALFVLFSGISVSLKDILIHLFFLHTFSYKFFWNISGSFWSLGPEIQFYLLLPIYLWLMLKLGASRRTKKRRLLLMGLLLFFPIFRFLFIKIHGPADLLIYNSYLFLGDSFATGMLLAEFKLSGSRIYRNCNSISTTIVCFFVYFFLCQYEVVVERSGSFNDKLFGSLLVGPLFNFLISIMFGALIVASSVEDSLTQRLFSITAIRKVGIYSYGIFIFHSFILHSAAFETLLKWVGWRPTSFFPVIGLLFCLSFVVGWASLRFIEAPVIRLGKGRPIRFNPIDRPI